MLRLEFGLITQALMIKVLGIRPQEVNLNFQFEQTVLFLDNNIHLLLFSIFPTLINEI